MGLKDSSSSEPDQSILPEVAAKLSPLVSELERQTMTADEGLRSDVAKFATETKHFLEEIRRIPTDSEGERDFRHDLRNRLNHLFGLLQLMRMGDISAEILQTLNHLTPVLEACLTAISSVGDSSAVSESASVTGSESDPITRQSPTGSPSHILVADDDVENREILRRLLEPRGFRISFAQDGVDAVEQMECDEFDAVLLDIQMPRMNGFQVLRHLRETGQLRNTPVIVVTGLQGEQDAVRCIEIGAEDFLSRPIRPALLMARLDASLEKKRLREKVFEQHFTPELARELARNPDPMKMQARQADVSVLFCDIRGFSSVSERLGAKQTIGWLSAVLGEFSSVVLDHGGVLVDYTGDELLAMWGAPNHQPDHATLACAAALDIVDRLPLLDTHWKRIIDAPTEVGIGINTGEALVGNIGTHLKFKYGPLGTAVNLASRVQGVTKWLDTSVLMTGATEEGIQGRFLSRRLCRVRVKNIRMPVDLYQPAPSHENSEWSRLTEFYEKALDAFERANFEEARDRVMQALKITPDDGPSRMLLERIQSRLTGSDGEFDPVWSVPGK